MTRPIPGELVRNPFLGSRMHAIAYYDWNRRAIYSDMLEKFAAHLKKRNKSHWQNVIVISGTTGCGKSTLMIELAMLLNPDLDLDPALIYYDKDLKKRLKLIRSGRDVGKINLFDEGSVILNSMNARSKSDNGIVILLDILRSWEMTTIICIPAFNDLNKRVRAHLVDYWIQCPESPLVGGFKSRGFYEIYKPKRSPWSDDMYWDCIGAGVYGPLPPDIDAEYQEIKARHQNEQVDLYIGGNEEAEI